MNRRMERKGVEARDQEGPRIVPMCVACSQARDEQDMVTIYNGCHVLTINTEQEKRWAWLCLLSACCSTGQPWLDPSPRGIRGHGQTPHAAPCSAVSPAAALEPLDKGKEKAAEVHKGAAGRALDGGMGKESEGLYIPRHVSCASCWPKCVSTTGRSERARGRWDTWHSGDKTRKEKVQEMTG